ncbi:hypothetical protein PILCRDRAFT_93229 [Piloderma croceum F 1598]|uniref:Uncharacterized protein n=1 Tax=Piloderma croceum (strain F 1598) TaxID=765440 RepID=A0A0C3EK79_PILCF|nr:hypothetical protein PILCRDRAFT_93229 [Piloderma croceum F 1598]
MRKPWDAFLVLMGMCSFLITFFQDNVPQCGVDILHWESILRQAKFNVNYIKVIKASKLTNFHLDYSQVGVFIQHFEPHFQHFVLLYIKYNVPVWIHWGNVNGGAPQHTRVLTQLLPFNSEVFVIRRVHTNKSAVEGTDSVSVCSNLLPEPNKSSRQKCGEHWHEIFSRMDVENIIALKKEDSKAREKQIAQEKAQKSHPLPGQKSSVKIYEWEEDEKTSISLFLRTMHGMYGVGGDEHAALEQVTKIEQATSDIPMSEPGETGGDELSAPGQATEIKKGISDIPMSEPGKTGGECAAPEHVVEIEQFTSDIPMSEPGETGGDELSAPKWVIKIKKGISDILMSEPGKTGGDERAPGVIKIKQGTSDIATEPGMHSASPPQLSPSLFTGQLMEDIYEHYGFIRSRNNRNTYKPTLEWSAIHRTLKVAKSAEEKTWKTVQRILGNPESSIDTGVRIPLSYFMAGLLDPNTNPLVELTPLWDLAINSVSPLQENINPNF